MIPVAIAAVCILLVLVIGAFLASIFNKLVALRNVCDNG